MNKNEFIEKRIKEIRERWFKNHVAEYELFGEGRSKIERLKWHNPQSSDFYIHYVTSGGCLMVYGDLGEQIYNFYRPISVRGFTDNNWEYYCGKAHNIDGYTKLYEWIDEHAAEWIADYGGDDLPEDWTDYLAECPEYRLVEYIYEETGDPEFAHGCYESGKAINIRALSHFVGLQMANEQLNKLLDKQI